METLSSKVSIFVARFTYKPAEMSPNPNYDQELAVTAGDYLYVYGDIDEDGFYHAQHQNGEVGMVPSNFVEKVPDEDGMLTDSRHKRIVSDGYIAETFAEESFCELVENEIFVEKLSLIAHWCRTRMPHPQISFRKLPQNLKIRRKKSFLPPL